MGELIVVLFIIDHASIIYDAIVGLKHNFYSQFVRFWSFPIQVDMNCTCWTRNHDGLVQVY